MKVKVETSNIENKLFFIIGLTCTWNALIVGGVAIYNYYLLLWLFFHIIKHHIGLHIIGKKSFFVNFFLLSIIFSLIASPLSIPQSWIASSIKSGIKYAFVFLTIFWLLDKRQLDFAERYFFRGIYYGALVQMVWGYLQFILYFAFKIRFNTLVFEKILGIQYVGGTRIVWDSYVGAGNLVVLRMKGLGWEAANFALAMVIGLILSLNYKKSPIIKFLFIGALLLSTSRSGWISLASVILAIIIKKLFGIEKRQKKNKKFFYEYCIISALIIVSALTFGNQISSIILGMIHNLKMSLDTSDAMSSSSLHIAYYTNLFKVLSKSNFFNILFGNGYFSAGYIASKNIKEFAASINHVGWNPESDFITLILGNGLFGCAGYYIFCFVGIIKHKLDTYSLMIIAIVTMGITYLTIRGTWSLLIIAFSLATMKNKKTLA